MELQFNAETSGHLAGQEIHRFLWSNIHARARRGIQFRDICTCTFLPPDFFTIYVHIALPFTSVYTCVSRARSLLRVFKYNLVYFLCTLYMCVWLSSAISPITEVLKNVFSFQLYESHFLAFCEGSRLRVSENEVLMITFGSAVKECRQIRNTCNALKIMFKIFTLKKHYWRNLRL